MLFVQEWKFDVDTRALIDNILIDYAGPFDSLSQCNVDTRCFADFNPPVFRELIQNADDAKAKEIEICFETEDKNERGDDYPGTRVRLPASY